MLIVNPWMSAAKNDPFPHRHYLHHQLILKHLFIQIKPLLPVEVLRIHFFSVKFYRMYLIKLNKSQYDGVH